MSGGTLITNRSADSTTLPFPFAGTLAPGQSAAISVPRPAVIAALGTLATSTSLVLSILPVVYPGPYDATYQGYLNADGSVTIPAGEVLTVGALLKQATYRGGAKFQHRTISATGTTAGAIDDYDVSFSDTSAPCVYQAVAMGAAAGERVALIIRDESYSGLFGQPNTSSITLKPVSGKKLNNVVDATLVILNGGGVISVEVDEFENMHQIGFSA